DGVASQALRLLGDILFQDSPHLLPERRTQCFEPLRVQIVFFPSLVLGHHQEFLAGLRVDARAVVAVAAFAVFSAEVSGGIATLRRLSLSAATQAEERERHRQSAEAPKSIARHTDDHRRYLLGA